MLEIIKKIGENKDLMTTINFKNQHFYSCPYLPFKLLYDEDNAYNNNSSFPQKEISDSEQTLI